MTDNLSKLTKKAAEIIFSIPKTNRIRIVSHYDADGIASAGVLCTALYQKGYNFHATLMRNPFTKGMDRLKKEENELIIFSDMGSAQIETIQQIGSKAIILDHHQYIQPANTEDIIQINANQCGIDGNYEASGSTLSQQLAETIDKNNEKLAPLALAGAIGDKQHIGGIKGHNKKILDKTLKNGLLTQKTNIKLHGDNIYEAIYYSTDPYYKNLSGNQKEIEDTLNKLNIPKDTKMEEIDKNKKIKLQSLLLFKLIKAGCQKNILDIAIRERYYSEQLGCELERFADLLDACGKNNHRSLGLSICLGDKNAFKEAEQVEKQYKQKILNALHTLENNGIQEMKSIRYFYSDNSSLGGVIGGIATNYIFDEKKPLFSLARKKEEIHISCRGNQQLVKNGLDLGYSMNKIATELGGHGGGHKIASGATIDIKKEKEFLEKTDKITSQQIQVKK